MTGPSDSLPNNYCSSSLRSFLFVEDEGPALADLKMGV